MKNSRWWEPQNFFDQVYFLGDDSKEGYDRNNKSLPMRTAEEVNGIIKLAGIEADETVLDAPCGYGRHSLELGRRKIKTVGVDINPNFINMAKEIAKIQKISNVEFFVSNISKMSLNRKFDIAINVYFSFGFYKRDIANFNFLRRIIDHVKDGGKFLIHTHIFLERFENDNIILKEMRELKNGYNLKISKELVGNREVGNWSIYKNNELLSSSYYSMRVYSLGEIKFILKKLNILNYSVFGDWSGSQFDKNTSHHLIIIGRKLRHE